MKRFTHLFLFTLSALISAGCQNSGGPPQEHTVAIDPVEDSADVDTDLWTSSWMLAGEGDVSPTFGSMIVNIENVYTKVEDGITYQCVQSSGIPNYLTEIDEDIFSFLVERPNATDDFVVGEPNVAVGDKISFGTDIGYIAFGPCEVGDDGAGYWPPGLQCPTDQEKDWCFPLDPEPATEACMTSLNQVGVWINGVSIFNWQDGQSYNGNQVWENEALQFEGYDLDICLGHSANGNYHNHSHPTCLQNELGDDGSAPSPIYGFAADGYPIYGPWEAAGVLAQSCWKTRDYDDPNSPTGCGVAGERSCLLVDQWDISKGTVPADSNGPSTSEVVTSMSGNPILAKSGVYFQDYYYDPACTEQGHEYLDDHNGHFDVERGYHYHTTLIANENGHLTFAFPHYIGPTYAGQLSENAIAQCGGGSRGPFNWLLPGR